MKKRLTAVFVLCCGPAGVAGPPQYTLTQLPPTPAGYTLMNAYDLGPQGQVVGRVYNLNVSPPLRRGFVWHNGSLTFLEGPAGVTRTEAWCMDDTGVIYGGYEDSRFDPIESKMLPARWVGGTVTPYANNQFINTATVFGCSPTTGVAVGWAAAFEPGAPGWQGQYGYPNELSFDDSPVRAFRWSGGTGEVIGRWFGLSDEGARDINDAGQVALMLNGFEMGGAGIFDPRFGVARLPDLGASLPNAGWASFPHAINEAGQIVGRSQAAGGFEHPVVWEGGTIKDLGLLTGFVEGEARDISDSGIIVGVLSNQNNPFGVTPTAGFVVVNGTMFNLNALIPPGSGVVIAAGVAINGAGQILVDTGQIFNSRYAVLTPVP